MKNTRTVRIAAGTVCLIVVALAMGWFVGRYIPVDPREPEPRIGDGLAPRSGLAIEKVIDADPGTTLKLSNITQGIKYMHTESDREPLSAAAVENWKESGNWEYDCPDINVSVLETKTTGTASFADWYPNYKASNWEVYNNSKIVAVTLSITNASEEDLVYWQDIPEFTLWSPNIANLDGSLGSGAMLDQAAFWDTNPPLRSFDESSTDPDRGRYIDLKPGESQTLVFPFKINKNNLIDQSAFDELDPSDFCIQTADYDPAPPTAFGCKRPPPSRAATHHRPKNTPQPLERIFRAMMYLARIRFARFHRLSAHETIETVKNDHAEGRRVWGRLTTPK